MFHFVIRTDASNSIGTGHVIRCLTLADALARNGAQVSFICREHEGHLCDLIEKRGYLVHRLPKPKDTANTDSGLSHAAWLGASWEEDAEQTIAILEDSCIKPDWLIVDHYAVDYRWERAVHPIVDKIFVIDDLADRDHDCDMLLDQNLVADMHTRYIGRVPEGCPLLLGPHYALLAPIYAELHNCIIERGGPIQRIFISFGGSDTKNLTGQVLEAFVSLKRFDIEVDVVVPNKNNNAAAIQRQFAGYLNIHLHGTLPTLAPLMANADLAIGAGGSTCWERLCLGLPTIVVTVADNQLMVADELQRRGFIWLIGYDTINRKSFAEIIRSIVESPSLFSLPPGYKEICDGRGVYRVSELLNSST